MNDIRHILHVLRLHGPCSVNEISDHTRLGRRTVQRIIREELSLVQIVINNPKGGPSAIKYRLPYDLPHNTESA